MKRVERIPEPDDFDEKVRKPGNAWLEANPEAKAERFPNHWMRCLNDLKMGFDDLCGYSAMWTSRPSVDHYRSKSSREGRSLTYEWENYRLADPDMNGKKGTWDTRILDPFEIENDWFEIRLPNLELVAVEARIPPERRDAAKFTLEKLGLGADEEILELRKSWYNEFIEGRAGLEFLSRRAPLVANAVKRRIHGLEPASFDDERTHFHSFIDGNITLKGLRRVAPRVAEAIEDALRG